MQVDCLRVKQPPGNKPTLYPLMEGVWSGQVPGQVPFLGRTEPLDGCSLQERKESGIRLKNEASVLKGSDGKSLYTVEGWLLHPYPSPGTTCLGPWERQHNNQILK
jgi:hypothetical protein